MAIKKVITDNKGQITEYHRIIAFAPIFVDGKEALNVNLISYTSEQYRNIEKNSDAKDMQVASTSIVLPLMENDTYTRENIYQTIMTLPEWANSEEI